MLSNLVVATALAAAPVGPPRALPDPAPAPTRAPPEATAAEADAAARALAAWGFDPSVLVADVRELLLRAPDGAVDGLFQVLLDTGRRPRQAQVVCGLFAPGADRSLAGLNAVAQRLDPAMRERYVLAVADMFVAAGRNPPRRFDVAAARQALRQAAVRAALLNDRFSAGLKGGDPVAGCRSAAMLLEALAPRPLAERAAVTRLLLIEGLENLARTR